MIRTVEKDIDYTELGVTYCHEHIIMDLSGIRKETDSVLSDLSEMVMELRLAGDLGVKSIVEVTNIGMGRNVILLQKAARQVNMNIICSTGFYKEDYYPEWIWQKSVTELAQLMIDEIQSGIDGTTIKAGIIAEIGSSFERISAAEEKIFQAAAKAHLKTGAPISTHCDMGTMAQQQAGLLLQEGVNADKVIIGHMDLNDNVAEILKILKNDFNVAFDTIGKNQFRHNEERIQALLKLLEAGYEDHILLSQDISRRSYLKKNGGQGYAYIFENFIPHLKKYGVEESALQKMMIENPARILDFESH
jgi:predicted metal-dependent phosphotriesterase family hydrolase